GLWDTLVNLIRNKINKNDDYFIFCEDDHQFMIDYDHNQLLDCIEKAKGFNADVLLGGVSWFEVAVKCKPNLFWINKFTGAQFMILFKSMYGRILGVDNFSKTDALDHKISALSSYIFTMYPFVSTQKEFGYSDVTILNSFSGRVDGLFTTASDRLKIIDKVHDFIHVNGN